MQDDESTRSYYEVIRDCCSETTTHGIPYVFKREPLVVKLVWLVCTLASAGVCGWLVSQSIMGYYDYEAVTKSKVVFETPTLFPTVTLCSLNMFTTQAGFDYVKNYSLNSGLNDAETLLSKSFFADFDFYKYDMGANLLDSAYSDDVRKTMGIQIDDMILTCYYNNMACSGQDFYWFFDPFYGSCFSFNSGKNSSGQNVPDYVSTKAGFMFGFQIELFVGNPTDANSYAFVSGLHVLVHNKSEKPTYLLGVNAKVGEHTIVQVGRTFSARLEKPYSDCVDDIKSFADRSLYVKTILDSNYTYKQSDCYDVCLQKYVVQDCGCYAVDIPFWNTSKVSPCRILNETDCYTLTMSYFFYGDLTKMCGDNCPVECESITYTTSVSSAVYPSDVFAAYMIQNPIVQSKFGGRSNMTPGELRQNILSLNVFYGSLSYHSFTEVEKTSVVDLVSNIGGTLGLFLGVSFLSFIEIIDLFVCLTLAFCKRSKGRSLVKPSSLMTQATINAFGYNNSNATKSRTLRNSSLASKFEKNNLTIVES